MRLFAAIALWLVTYSSALEAQRVLIKGATPAEVVVAINTRISPQGFRLEDSTQRQALFALDRGLVSQTSGTGLVQAVQVVLELRLRFKQKGDSLQVDASEEAVGARNNRQFEFRKPVRSRAELDAMQTLLEAVKQELETRPSTP